MKNADSFITSEPKSMTRQPLTTSTPRDLNFKTQNTSLGKLSPPDPQPSTLPSPWHLRHSPDTCHHAASSIRYQPAVFGLADSQEPTAECQSAIPNPKSAIPCPHSSIIDHQSSFPRYHPPSPVPLSACTALNPQLSTFLLTFAGPVDDNDCAARAVSARWLFSLDGVTAG